MKLTLLLCLTIALASSSLSHQFGVRLEDVKELTFRKDVWTKNVRDPPTTQLVFAGGNARRNTSQIKQVRCVNLGDDWNCTVANLDPVLNFTKVSINCEGATHSDDENVLLESCYLEYNLNFMPVVKLIDLTNTTPLVNVTNDTDDTCLADNFTRDDIFYPFSELSDDPETQKIMLLTTAIALSLLILMCGNCNCESKKQYVVDNAEDASGDSEGSDDAEELRM